MLRIPAPDSSLSDAQLELAESLVASALDMPDLAERSVSEAGTVGSSGMIALRLPAVSIQSLTLSGAPAAGILSNPRFLDVSGLVSRAYGSPWGHGYSSTPYAITYTAGWTLATLPTAIRQAVLLAAQAQAASAGMIGIKSESMGPVSRTYQDSFSAGALTLPGTALALLTAWLPLRV